MTEQLRHVGKRAGRLDLHSKITGRALYVDDMHLPNMVHARLKRASEPHAMIRSIDTSAARALPGVLCVLTGDDFPKRYGILPVHQDETALAVEKVRYAGEPVAAVCAETEQIAQRALDLIRVEYEPLPPILSLESAVKAPSRLHESAKFQGNAHRVIALEFGDVEEAMGRCEYTREDLFYFSGSTHLPMESHSTVADFDGQRLTVHVSTQAPYYVQKILPDVIGLPAQHLRVVVPYVGGGFGGKLEAFPDTICAAKFSMLLGRPVKLTLSREEVFYNHRGRHPSLIKMRTGLLDGRIAAMHVRALLDGGAYGSFGTAASFYHGALQPVTYRIGNYKAEIARFYTNKPPCGPKRGHGTPQPRFALECHLDKIAEDLRMSPVELRKKNFTPPHSVTVNHIRVGSSGLADCVERVVAASNFETLRGKLPEGEGIGLAVGCYLSGAALPIHWNDMPHSEVLVKADRSGVITAYSGHTEIGQGADMVLAVVVAECLGIDPEDVALTLRDSDSVPPDLGSYSSRVTMMMGNAAKTAALKLRAVLAEAAARRLECDSAELEFTGRTVHHVDDTQRVMSLEEAIVAAEEANGALSFSGSYTPDVKFGDFKGAGVGPSPAYSFSASVVRLSVDSGTGFVRPSKVWIAHDIGRCISPTNVKAQVEGGVYMALGEAQMEEMVFTREGILRNCGMLDYKHPTIVDMPEIETIIVESEDSNGPFGAKEVGQGPLLPVIPAFANAVYDAIGVRFDTVPISPEKVLRAMQRGEKRVGPREVAFAFRKPIQVEVGQDAPA